MSEVFIHMKGKKKQKKNVVVCKLITKAKKDERRGKKVCLHVEQIFASIS